MKPSLRLSRRFIFPVMAISALILAVVVGILIWLRRHNTEAAGRAAAKALADQVAVTRSYYTNEVVERAKESGVEASHDFEQDEASIPLPRHIHPPHRRRNRQAAPWPARSPLQPISVS